MRHGLEVCGEEPRVGPFCKKSVLWASLLLSAPAAGYYGIQKLREQFYSWGLLRGIEPPIPVISVGNVLLGGSGKTPFTIYLAELLRHEGFMPAVVSRGYKASNDQEYLVVSDGHSCGPLVEPSLAGDEPYLMASRAPEIPVLIGRKRIHPVRAAHELFKCDVAVLDDGFQHLQLARRLNIVLLNGSEDHMFPKGRLREPLSALQRADVVLLVGIDSIPENAGKFVSKAQVFHCRFEPSTLESHDGSHSCSRFKDSEVVLCSAIAGPERFRNTAEQLGWLVAHHWVFRDHHRFTDSELLEILEDAADQPIVATEKDWVKFPDWFKQKSRVFALSIKTVVDDETRLISLLKRTIRK
jgi:tetraacyldisaccharide 4'-kinase